MPDPLKGIPIDIDGQRRTVLFTHRAQRIAQRRLNGRPLSEIMRGVRDTGNPDIGMDVLVELAAAGFEHEDKKISADLVESMLERDPRAETPLLTAVLQAYVECKKHSMPKGAEEELNKRLGEQKAPANESTGAPSEGGPTSTSSSGSAVDTPST